LFALKVGAPPEMVSLLEAIGRGNYKINSFYEIGADPELDEFMVYFETHSFVLFLNFFVFFFLFLFYSSSFDSQEN